MVRLGAALEAICTIIRSFENPPERRGSVKEAARAAIASSSSSGPERGTGAGSMEVAMEATQKGSRSLTEGSSAGRSMSSGCALVNRSSIAQRVVKPAPRGNGMEHMASRTLDCSREGQNREWNGCNFGHSKGTEKRTFPEL